MEYCALLKRQSQQIFHKSFVNNSLRKCLRHFNSPDLNLEGEERAKLRIKFYYIGNFYEFPYIIKKLPILID